MALHYDVDTDVNGDDLSGFGIWLAALHDDHEDDVGDVFTMMMVMIMIMVD